MGNVEPISKLKFYCLQQISKWTHARTRDQINIFPISARYSHKIIWGDGSAALNLENEKKIEGKNYILMDKQ